MRRTSVRAHAVSDRSLPASATDGLAGSVKLVVGCVVDGVADEGDFGVTLHPARVRISG